MSRTCNIIQLETLDSTHLFLERIYLRYPEISENTVVIAKSQSAGKGQGTNSWYSSAGKNLLFSMILKPDFLPAEKQFLLNIAVSLAIREAIQSLLPEREVKVKWPNDIYVGNQKIAGILIKLFLQNDRIEAAIASAGINVNESHFPNSIPNPVSLFLQTRKCFSVAKIFHSVSTNLFRQYQKLQYQDTETLISGYLNQMYLFDQYSYFQYEGKKIKAKISGISPFGQLILILFNGEKLICDFREIRFLHPEMKKSYLSQF